MKTVHFQEHLVEHQITLDKEEKDDGLRITEMTEISSPSAQTWLENFDADQDSLLDYFLNGEHDDTGNGNAMDADHRMTQSQHAPSDKTRSGNLGYESSPHQASSYFLGTPPSGFHFQPQSDPQSDTTDTATAQNRNPLPTPSTPAMQFYAGGSNKLSSRNFNPSMDPPSAPSGLNAQLSQHHHHQTIAYQPQNHPPSKPPSSSPFSLQGMGSTPILHVHQQFKAQASSSTPFTVSSMSPISPAVMCTNEVLMLPSNTPNGTGTSQNINISTNQQLWQNNVNAARANMNSTTTHQHAGATNNPKMELPAWLQHMNNVASLASQAGTSGSAMGISAQSRNQNILHNPAFSNQHHGQQHPAFYQHQHQYTAAPGANQHQHSQVFSGSDILPIPGSMMAMQHGIDLNDEHASESKEKRKKRLARNRESARQSRRRKKELLLNLRKQVNALHDKIEHERRKHLENMEEKIMADRTRILNEIFLDQRYNGQSAAGMDRFISTVRNCGPNIKERRSAMIFQYNALKKVVLPFYRQIFLTMSLRDRKFFTDAKEKKIKEALKTTGRVSSKLVGEDIAKKHAEDLKEGHALKNNVSCNASDGAAFWPLLCYELSVGIEQEEKFVQAFDNIRMDPEMPQTRAKMTAVSTMVSNLKEGLTAHTSSVTNQNELALLQILTPAQSLRFSEWFLRNKDRCSRLLANGDGGASNDGGDVQTGQMTKATSDHSLTDFCKQLTDTMNIKKIEQEDQKIV